MNGNESVPGGAPAASAWGPRERALDGSTVRRGVGTGANWDAMLADTTPWGQEHKPAPDDLARERLYEAWLKEDIRRRGVMARHAWNAAWAAGRHYEQEQTIE